MSLLNNVRDAFANAEGEVAALLQTRAQLKANVQTLRTLHSEEVQRSWKVLDNLVEETKVEISAQLKQLQEQRDGYLVPRAPLPEVITLNVGGSIYTTTLATLRKEKDSMLSAMFSGLYSVATDRNGNYFLDRDGSLFRHVLTYLRTGSPPSDLTPGETKRLRAEADFYGLAGLLQLLDIDQRKIRQRFAVLQYNQTFVPSAFIGPAPEGIELFYFQGDCYRSCKDMTEVLKDMRSAGWKLHLSVAPAHCGNSQGRLVFMKEDVVPNTLRE
eukprot:PhF_6_TR1561/c0_g1_i1/m.2844